MNGTLEIIRSDGSSMAAFGGYENLEREMQAWVAYECEELEAWEQAEESGLTYRDVRGRMPRILVGFEDSSERKIVKMAYRFIEVVAMILMEA